MIRFEVHVRPGAHEDRVGGRQAGALVVRVRARTVDGAATEAVLTVLAKAFDVPRREVVLLRGHTSRRKFVQIDGETSTLSGTHLELLERL